MYNKPTIAFRCPICRSGAFEQVIVRRTRADPYVTDFLQCAGCSVMFRDATQFTRFEPCGTPAGGQTRERNQQSDVAAEASDRSIPSGDSDREAKRRARLVRN